MIVSIIGSMSLGASTTSVFVVGSANAPGESCPGRVGFFVWARNIWTCACTCSALSTFNSYVLTWMAPAVSGTSSCATSAWISASCFFGALMMSCDPATDTCRSCPPRPPAPWNIV